MRRKVSSVKWRPFCLNVLTKSNNKNAIQKGQYQTSCMQISVTLNVLWILSIARSLAAKIV